MLDSWLTQWGHAIPEYTPGLAHWPVIAVIVLMLMVNVAANKAVPGYYLFWTLGGSVVVLALGVLDDCTWADLGLAPGTWIRGAVWGAAAMAIIFTVYAVGSTWRRTRAAFHDTNIAGLSLTRLFWQALVELPFGTVLFEEIAFRGVLWAMLARRYGVLWATIWSSLLFGLWHILPSLDLHLRNERLAGVGGGGWWARATAIGGSVITTMIGGIVFCVLRIMSGSLIAPMGLHWATNGWGYLFARRVASRRNKG
jgi:uncharacterized protein